MTELESALKDEGIPVSSVGVRGSSVTYHSNNPKKVGSFFDKRGKGTSDIDVFFVTKAHLKPQPSKTGFFSDKKIAEKYPKIDAWNNKWTGQLGRKVAAAGFRPTAPMKPGNAEAIVHSGAL